MRGPRALLLVSLGFALGPGGCEDRECRAAANKAKTALASADRHDSEDAAEAIATLNEEESNDAQRMQDALPHGATLIGAGWSTWLENALAALPDGEAPTDDEVREAAKMVAHNLGMSESREAGLVARVEDALEKCRAE